MTASRGDLFTALKSKTCSTCNALEPSQPLPGWPLNGQFIVIRNGKLCLGCAREVNRKLEVLGVLSEDRRS